MKPIILTGPISSQATVALQTAMRTAQDSWSNLSRDQRLWTDARNLACLAKISALLTRDSSQEQILAPAEPAKIAAKLDKMKFDFNTSPDLLLSAVDDCMTFLQKPAETGLVFLMRTEVSTWGLETVITIFYSALFLSKWNLYLSHAGSIVSRKSHLIPS